MNALVESHKVLVLDADALRRRRCVQILAGEGYWPLEAVSREELWSLLAAHQPAALVLSLFFEEGSALSLLEDPRLRGLVVIGVAHILEGATVRMEVQGRFGVADVLEPPVTGGELIGILREHLGRPMQGGCACQLVDDANRVWQRDAEETTWVGKMPLLSDGEGRAGAEEASVSQGAASFGRVRTAPKLRAVGRGPVPGRLSWRAAPDAGLLRQVSFGALLARCLHTRFSGVLTLWRQRVKKTVYLEGGCPVAIRSNLRHECLGSLLVREGLLSWEQCGETVGAAQAEGRRHGEVLLARGLLTQAQLGAFLALQMRERLLDVFAWSEGRYQMHEGGSFPTISPMDRAEALRIIVEGVMTHVPLSRLLTDLAPCGAYALRLDVEEALLNTVGWNEAQREIVAALIDGGSLVELVAHFPLPYPVHSVLYALFVLGFVSLDL